jgi:hypothetical protein
LPPPLREPDLFAAPNSQEATMPRKRTTPSQLARHVAEIAIAAPQVIAARTLRMALAGATPSAKDQREFTRMHAEKHDALQQGWLAMWNESLRIQQRTALTLMGAWWMPKSTMAKLTSPAALTRDALSILGKGIAPVRHTAVANATRLGNGKRR